MISRSTDTRLVNSLKQYIQLYVLRRATRTKNSDWPAGSRQRIAADHVRVPSPMIGQYNLDSPTNSIRDTGQQLVEVSTSQFQQFIKSSCFDNCAQPCNDSLWIRLRPPNITEERRERNTIQSHHSIIYRAYMLTCFWALHSHHTLCTILC